MKIPMLRLLLRFGMASALLFSCQSRTSVGSPVEHEMPRIEWLNVPAYGEQGELTGNVIGLDPNQSGLNPTHPCLDLTYDGLDPNNMFSPNTYNTLYIHIY